MISIIVCHKEVSRLNELRQNITDTIGVPHELIVINNQASTFGICEAYNRGAQQTQYEYLCFVHKDILFRIHAWGPAILALLPESTVGLVGVRGSEYKALSVSAWWDGHGNTMRGQIIHRRATGTGTIHHCYNPKNEKRADVVSLDGLFLATQSP